nr:LysR substrate-binding domain-containing protein [Psychrobacter sp. PraFG1]UTT87748.1 LysR substrate-binding domain-containing protein [Psychrobacter sp. PraFG1]
MHLKDISSFKQIGALKAGEIDVGFGRFAHNDEHIYQLLLRHERYVAALPNTHELAGSHDIHLSQLQNSRVILYHQTHLPVPQLASASTTEAQNTDLVLLASRCCICLPSAQPYRITPPRLVTFSWH